MHAYIYTSSNVCMHMFACVYVCMHVCMHARTICTRCTICMHVCMPVSSDAPCREGFLFCKRSHLAYEKLIYTYISDRGANFQGPGPLVWPLRPPEEIGPSPCQSLPPRPGDHQRNGPSPYQSVPLAFWPSRHTNLAFVMPEFALWLSSC